MLGLPCCLLTQLSILIIIFKVAKPAVMYEEYCQWESFNVTCPEGEYVVMEYARYGRMSVGRCLKKTYEEHGCSIDILPFMDSVCSGRRRCKVGVPDIAMQGIRPCSEDFTSFLQASYRCVKAVAVRPSDCRFSKSLTVSSPSGYLASEAMTSDPFTSCSYHIRAEPGQKINLTLYDFSVRSNRMSGQDDVCRRYALVREGTVKETPICGGLERIRTAVYISDGSDIFVTLLNGQTPDDKSYYMLKYEAEGCGRVKPPPNAYVERSADTWIVACNFTQQRWYLHCDHSTWVGSPGNCSQVTKTDLWNVLTEDWSSPYGILVVVGLGVALGIVIGILLLAVVLLWLRRNRLLKRSEKSSEGDTRNYQTYSTESTYAPCDSRWLSNRPLPVPNMDDTVLKQNPDMRGLDPAVIHELQGKYPHHHIYESSSFPRRDLNNMDI